MSLVAESDELSVITAMAKMDDDVFAQQWNSVTSEERKSLSAYAMLVNLRYEDPSPGHLAMRLDPLTVQTPALDIIDEHLVSVRDAIATMYQRRAKFAELMRSGMNEDEAIERSAAMIPATGCDRLIVSMPPQEGKSMRITRYGVLWLLKQFPTLRIGIVSYDGDKAGEFSQAVRGDIELHDGTAGNVDLGLRLMKDQRAKSRWTLTTGGSVYAIGIGGGLTGKALDCVTGDTPIITERGVMLARNVHRAISKPRVLSFNHDTNKAEWRRVEATRETPKRELYELVTTGGRVVRCTGDHRVYTDTGYRRASTLVPGDRLVTMRSLRDAIHDGGLRTGEESQEGQIEVLLLNEMRGELAFQGRNELRQMVRTDATAHQGARRGLSSLRETGDNRSSHRRRPKKQRFDQPDSSLRDVSRYSPQVEDDTVSMVRRLHGESEPVYDLQVEGNCNFFAGEILVHNCLIIDDPVKDNKAAESLLQSQTAWEWWQTVARPRLAPWAPVIEVQTRWHELDLAGRMQTKQNEDETGGVEHSDRWTVISIPAQADHNPNEGEVDILGRDVGEFMVSARGRTRAQWEATKSSTEARFWSALFQGRPTPDIGDVLLKEWWRRYDTPLWTDNGDGSFRILGGYDVSLSCDFAFKDKKTSDFVVIQVWAKKGPNSFLIYQVRSRLAFTKTVESVRMVSKMFPQAHRKIIEAKANGDAVIDTLKGELSGILPVTPDQSKEARARAVSLFVQAGNFHIPTSRVAMSHPVISWTPDDFIVECTAFPNGTNDDQVDAFTQYAKMLYIEGGEASILSPVGAGSRPRRKTEKTVVESPMAKRLAKKGS